MQIKKLNNWIVKQKKKNLMNIKRVNLSSTEGWGINSFEIFNKKKNFFQ